MKKTVATIAILLLVLPLLTKATLKKSVDPKEVVIINNRMYYFSSILGNAAEAITVCQELGMTLAGLETQQEYDAVTDYIITDIGSTVDYFWTSGILQHTMWIWGNTGEPVSYFKWDAGEPNGSPYNLCVRNGFMHDCIASSSIRFICEEKTLCSSC